MGLDSGGNTSNNIHAFPSGVQSAAGATAVYESALVGVVGTQLGLTIR